MGRAAVPLNMLILGASLAQGARWSADQAPSVFSGFLWWGGGRWFGTDAAITAGNVGGAFHNDQRSIPPSILFFMNGFLTCVNPHPTQFLDANGTAFDPITAQNPRPMSGAVGVYVLCGVFPLLSFTCPASGCVRG